MLFDLDENVFTIDGLSSIAFAFKSVEDDDGTM